MRASESDPKRRAENEKFFGANYKVPKRRRPRQSKLLKAQLGTPHL